ncbi:MAG TPA: hypothetical protein HA264_02470 [Methanolinea sp.]|nr:hypothetical protein [Methanolinea sp.]HNQ29558.1 hypothetical protein [Methanolinea sp.]
MLQGYPDQGCCSGDHDGCIPIRNSSTMTDRAMQGISALRWSGDVTPFRTVAVSFMRIIGFLL